jgi:predicted DNA-binding transcriptional regulator AlpA
MLTPQAFDELVALLADALAPRIAAELATKVPAPAVDDRDPWRLLGVEEVAERLGRSTRWVRDRAKRGDLPWIRLDGGALAFDLADVQEFALARRVSADDAGSLAGRLQGGRKCAA